MAPLPVGPPGGKRRVQVGDTEIAKASVMRLENSLEKSSCLTGGSSPLFVLWKVGIENSSLTPGSSIVRVAGKNRLPAISCAAAPERGINASASPGKAGSNRTRRDGLPPSLLSLRGNSAANSSLPPCGEGLGVGVVRGGTALPQP